MVELADAQDLGSCAARRVGSTPTTRIREKARWYVGICALFLCTILQAALDFALYFFENTKI